MNERAASEFSGRAETVVEKVKDAIEQALQHGDDNYAVGLLSSAKGEIEVMIGLIDKGDVLSTEEMIERLSGRAG